MAVRSAWLLSLGLLAGCDSEAMGPSAPRPLSDPSPAVSSTLERAPLRRPEPATLDASGGSIDLVEDRCGKVIGGTDFRAQRARIDNATSGEIARPGCVPRQSIQVVKGTVARPVLLPSPPSPR
jgi:hypothetical protein